MSVQDLKFLAIASDRSDRAWLEFLRQAIEEIGYGRICAAQDMSEGLAVLAGGYVDFVICEWNDDAGPEIGLLKLIKKQEAYRAIPVLLTGRAHPKEDERIKRAAAAGVDGYLHMPYDVEQLRRSLDDILARYGRL